MSALIMAPPSHGGSVRGEVRRFGVYSPVLTVLAAAVVGLWFWPVVDAALPLAVVMLAVFTLGRLPRWHAFAVASAFYLATTSPFITIGPNILEFDIWRSAMWWGLHGLVGTLPILLLRGKFPGRRAALVALLFIVPPFGYITPSNPSLLIGLLFPGSSILGPLGFVALAALIGGFDRQNQLHIRALVILTAISLELNAISLITTVPPPANWHAVETTFGNNGADLQRRMDLSNMELPAMLKDTIASNGAPRNGEVWFLGEGMIYDHSALTDFFWRRALAGTGATVIAGGYERNPMTHQLTSRAYMFRGSKADLASTEIASVRAGMTFPMTMWRPWNPASHFPMQWPASLLRVGDKLVHLSWCYEDTLVWPHLLASLRAPDVMVSLENRWATRDTSLEPAQQAAATLNARWLGLPLLRAINR